MLPPCLVKSARQRHWMEIQSELQGHLEGEAAAPARLVISIGFVGINRVYSQLYHSIGLMIINPIITILTQLKIGYIPNEIAI